ncbi:unnamed protein product [Ectocarpus sp. CCAP 1310/34]|nr:unnamed protein product [Ectocarpus sp. CCAP 1310/34]
MRRLARAHPEAVAAISPSAVEDSRSVYAASVPRSKSQVGNSGAKVWTNADLGTPEFFAWLNTVPHNTARRLEKVDEDDEQNDQDDDEGDALGDGPLNIGKAFLIPRAKMSLYDQDIFAHSMLEARDKVLAARSPGQLRKAHDRLRETETALNLRAGNYRTVKVGFEEPAPSAGSTDGLPQTEPAHSSSRASGRANRVVYGPSETFAYVYHRMVPAYTVLHRVMAEVKSELPDFNPRTMLDFGSGPGTSALAVWDVWGAGGGSSVAQDGEETRQGSNLSEVRMVEESQSMKDACKIMLEPLTNTGRIRTGFGTSLLEEARTAGRGGAGGAPGGRKFDLVVAAYALSHLPTHASRAAATAVMWSLVAPGGVLVLVEDGSAKGSHTVRSARHMVLRPSAPAPEQGGDTGKQRGNRRGKKNERQAPPRPYVVGPCRHDKECPLQAGEFCRLHQKARKTTSPAHGFRTTWAFAGHLISRQRATGTRRVEFIHRVMPKCKFQTLSHSRTRGVPWNAVNVTSSAVKSVSFSYVSIRKGPPEREADQDERVGGRTSSSSVDLLKAFVQQRKNLNGGGSLRDAMDSLGTDGISDAILRRDDWARLVRKPLKAKGHALLDVCSPEGNIQRKVVAKGKWKGVPGMFVAARKSQVGGLWPYLDNHDYKDRTAKLDDASSGQQGGEFFSFDPSEDGDDGVDFLEGDSDGEWEEVGDEERGPVVDWAEGGVRGPAVGSTGTPRRRPRTLPAALGPRGSGSSEEGESQAIFEEKLR